MIEINSEGFQVNALDRSHITFVSLNLDKEFFDEFECSEDGSKICIDTNEFYQILKRMKKTDVLRLADDDNNLVITLLGDSTREFKIRFIDMEYDVPTPPSINPPCGVQIESNLLKDNLGDMEIFSNIVTYRVDEDYFYAEADGEFGDSSFKYLHGENLTETAKSSFSSEMLKNIFVASKFSSICTLLIGNDMPLILRYELDTGDGELRFLLAPRLQEEE